MSDVLWRFPEDELPPSRVDIRQLMRAGRRRRRVRRAFTAASVATVLSVGAGTAPIWLSALPGQGGISNPGTAACPEATPLPPLPSSSAWERFDPLKYEVDVSALTGYEVVSYATSTYFQEVVLVGPDSGHVVTVTLYAAGGQPHYRTTDGPAEPLDPGAGTPADEVHDIDAFWLPDQNLPGAQQGLAWQWTPGAWVFVTAGPTETGTAAEPVNREELRSISAEVAPQLRFGAGSPVMSPFALAVPQCTRVSGTSLVHGTRSDNTPFTRFMVSYSTAETSEPRNPLVAPGTATPAVVVAATLGTGPEDKPAPLTEVDGYEAYLGDCTSAESCEVGTVYGMDGFAVELDGDIDLGITVLDLVRSIYIYADASTGNSWGSPIP